ncbi:MAG: UDP-N-acetylmuramoyl-L-alanine--D-glutamate ligase [Hyphomonadaceae bacterium]
MIPITEFAGRDVAVFGLARSGVAAALALVAGGARVHAWDDSEASRAKAAAAGAPIGEFEAARDRRFAALVLSPGVPLTHPRPHRVVEWARAAGVPVIGDIELFARAVNALAPSARPKVIGVTGTNGKSTTTALIGHVLAQAGKDVRVGGNIGVAALDLPALHGGAIYVLELSSFQLDLTESLRCDAAILLNITPDHIDRHGDLAGYAGAKRRIFANQGAGDWAIVGVDTPDSARICTELTAAGAQRVVAISNAQALGRGVSALGAQLYDAIDGAAKPALDLARAAALPGKHNAQNVAAAYAACAAMGLGARAIAAGVESFPGLAHRMERAGAVHGVRFVNDSKATNADAAAQALACYDRVYWIAGGVPKEGGIAPLVGFFPRMAKAYLIGEAAPAFAATLEGHVPVTMAGALEAAVRAAYADARAEQGLVLFSPACASFDQFRDFEARGEDFKEIVARIGQEAEA